MSGVFESIELLLVQISRRPSNYYAPLWNLVDYSTVGLAVGGRLPVSNVALFLGLAGTLIDRAQQPRIPNPDRITKSYGITRELR